MALTGRKNKPLQYPDPAGVEDLYLCLLDWSVNEVTRLLFTGEVQVVLRETWNSVYQFNMIEEIQLDEQL